MDNLYNVLWMALSSHGSFAVTAHVYIRILKSTTKDF